MLGRAERLFCVVALATALVALAAGPAAATQKFGPLQLSGNLQSQQLIRHPDVSTYEFVMQRNTAHIRLDYDWLERGKFYNKYNIPFIDRSHLFLLWRGVYDSTYTTTPGFIEKNDIHGKAYEGKSFFQYARENKGLSRARLQLEGLGHETLNTLQFENDLREAYVDIKFRGLPLSVRAGKQQIVWGESDNFRMLDRVNTLDLTWHLVQEIPPPAYGWDELRRPFWMFKFLYDIGNAGPLSQTFLEWYWNPGDWRPAKISFLPRPWGVKLYDPLTNPVDGGFISGVCENAPGRQCTSLMNGTKLFEKGDYHRNPMENSQVGVRYHAIIPSGLEMTAIYYYQRWGGDDGSAYAPIQGLPKTPKNLDLAYGANGLISRGILPAEFIAPYVHTVGLTGNYSDEQYTQAVFRFETGYDVGIPFFDLVKTTVIDRPVVPGVTKKNMWKGMIAADRSTWIRWLNRKTTVGLTSQMFWHYMVNNTACQPQLIATALGQGRSQNVQSCLVGPLDLPSTVRTNSSPDKPAYRDKIRDWEMLFTVAGFTFYRGGSLLPIAGIAVDPMNHWVMEPFWSLDYVIRDDLVFNVTQRYFVTPAGTSDPNFGPWGFGSIMSGRSETGVRLTYQF